MYTPVRGSVEEGALRPPSGTFAREPVRGAVEEGTLRPPSGTFARADLPAIAVPTFVTTWLPPTESVSVKLAVWFLGMFCFSAVVVGPPGYYFSTPLALLRVGVLAPEYLQCVACGYIHELRRVFVATFLHTNLVHVLFNTMFILGMGYQVECVIGSAQFLKFFLATATWANLVAVAFGWSSMCGASTGGFALIGYRVMTDFLAWPRMTEPERLHLRQTTGKLIAFVVVWELLGWSTLSHWGHFCGFVAGAATTACMSVNDFKKTVLVSKICLVAFPIVATILLFLPLYGNYGEFRQVCHSLQQIYF